MGYRAASFIYAAVSFLGLVFVVGAVQLALSPQTAPRRQRHQRIAGVWIHKHIICQQRKAVRSRNKRS